MASVKLTINGQEVTAQAGQTILDAAQEAGIDIPTLCHHPALKPIGACRVCLVEVAGQRTLQPACTFPVAAGQRVETESPKVVQARKFVLDLIFTERNHFCMYCEMTGDCELQDLAYRYGLDHMAYPTYTQAYGVDASPEYHLLDHNRCVLCRRCVRACAELAANHTLGLLKRGSSTRVHADMSLPLGTSSCISCGTCLDVCPTGALTDKRSAFMGRSVRTEAVTSTCSRCSVGCGIRVVTRGDNVLRIEGDPDTPGTRHMVCKRGRFEPLYDRRQRLTRPALNGDGSRKEVSWEEATRQVASRLREAGPGKVGLLVSSDATNEALAAARKLFAEQLGVDRIGLLNPAAPLRAQFTPGTFDDLTASDCILVAGADPVRDHPVVSFLVKRAVDRGARLILLGDEPGDLALFTDTQLKEGDTEKAAAMLEQAASPVVVYGTGLSEEAGRVLARLEGKASFLPLVPGVNTRAAADLGFNGSFDPSGLAALYVICGEEDWDGGELLERIPPDTFVVVQAAYESPVAQRANVILPSAIWSERGGTVTNTLGEVRPCTKAVEPPGEVRADREALSMLEAQLAGKP